MAEALLRIDGLDAGYGDVQVLWDVSLEVPRGELIKALRVEIEQAEALGELRRRGAVKEAQA